MSTLQKTYEEIQQAFPDVGQTQIIFDLDRAQKNFISETRYLYKSVLLSNITTAVAWILPSDHLEFKELKLYNADNEPLYLADYNLDYEISEGNFYIKSKTSIPITKLPSDIASAYLTYYYSPATLTAITDNFSVNDEHILGVSSQVYEEYYAKFPVGVITKAGEWIKTRDFNAVGYWRSKAKEYRIKAKRYAVRKDKLESRGAVNYGMAGDFDIAKYPKLTPVTI